MPRASIQIPIPACLYDAELIYLERMTANSGGGVLSYLQGIRSGVIRVIHAGDPEQSLTAQAYRAHLPLLRAKLVKELGDAPISFMASPPSSRSDAEPYRESLKKAHPEAADLTSRFARSSVAAKAGLATDFAEVLANTSYTPGPDLTVAESLLIVDDVFSTGKTAAALVSRLRDHGLPQSCRLIFAAPLYASEPQ